jgi:UPF0271 protein
VGAGRHVDLNSDVGEGFGAWPGGPDDELVGRLTSVNVACGYHAGDPLTMRRTCALAAEAGCVIGAQVSYPDLVGFGRRFIDMQPDDLAAAVVYQLGALDGFARLAGTSVRYVKPHGALYNAIVTHELQARAVAEAVHAYDPTLPLMGLPESAIQRECERSRTRFVREGFADRRYTADGLLVKRTEPDALITDPTAAAAQALRLAAKGMQSICVHSDTPGAPAILAAVADALTADGFGLRSFVL